MGSHKCKRKAILIHPQHKPIFKPGADLGDHVVVLNSDSLALTADKLHSKVLYKHSGYPGGLKARVMKDRLQKDSREVVFTAVKRMLPSGSLQLLKD